MMISTVPKTFSLPTLRLRNIGSDVILVQRLLNQSGYAYLAEDGLFCPITATVVKQFQKDRNLTVDGIVDSQTWKALLPQTLSRGSNSPDVELLQLILNEMGYGPLSVDGVMTLKTEKAVKHFQKDLRLEVDGIVDSLTWYVLLIDRIKD